MRVSNGNRPTRVLCSIKGASLVRRALLFLFLLGFFLSIDCWSLRTFLSKPSIANAVVESRQQHSVRVTSSAWGAVAQGRNQSVTRSPYLLMWTVTGGTAYNYFGLRNTGTLPLQAIHVLITQVRISGSNRPNEIFFERCLGGSWNSTTHTCSGTVIEVGRASQTSFPLSNLDLGVNSFVDMRARTQPNSQNIFDTTLDVHVSRNDFRLPEVRNS